MPNARLAHPKPCYDVAFDTWIGYAGHVTVIIISIDIVRGRAGGPFGQSSPVDVGTPNMERREWITIFKSKPISIKITPFL